MLASWHSHITDICVEKCHLLRQAWWKYTFCFHDIKLNQLYLLTLFSKLQIKWRVFNLLFSIATFTFFQPVAFRSPEPLGVLYAGLQYKQMPQFLRVSIWSVAVLIKVVSYQVGTVSISKVNGGISPSPFLFPQQWYRSFQSQRFLFEHLDNYIYLLAPKAVSSLDKMFAFYHEISLETYCWGERVLLKSDRVFNFLIPESLSVWAWQSICELDAGFRFIACVSIHVGSGKNMAKLRHASRFLLYSLKFLADGKWLILAPWVDAWWAPGYL